MCTPLTVSFSFLAFVQQRRSGAHDSFQWSNAFAELMVVKVVGNRTDSFSQLIECEVGLVKNIFHSLPFSELRNTAMVCKSFNRLFKEDPSLTWRLDLRGAPSFTSLCMLENKAVLAPPLAPILMESQPLLFSTHRKILLDWLVDVQGEYQLSIESLHTAFLLIDRCMQLKNDIPTKDIQLLGATCLFVASKFCETSHPSLSDMVWVCDHAFSHQQHRNMEMEVLFLTGFLVRTVTPCSYIEGLCHLLQQTPATQALANYLADLFMLEATAVGVRASRIAAACMVVATHNLEEGQIGLKLVNLSNMAYLTNNSVADICQLACKIQQVHVLDYCMNGAGKQDPLIKVPQQSRQPPLRAVFERHSVVKQPVSNDVERPCPAALRTPKRIVLVHGSHSPNLLCCCWCKKVQCAEALKTTFATYIQQGHASPLTAHIFF